MKVSTVLDHVEYGDMTLPEFQRGYVWNRNQVRGLFSSLYHGYPVGGLLIWTTEIGPSLRRDDVDAPGVVKLLLDGQQRITSIFGVMRGRPPEFFQGNERAFSDLYFDLRTETFEFYGPVKMKGDPLWVSVTDLYQDGIEQMIHSVASPDDDFSKTLGYQTRLARIFSIRDRVLHIEEITGNEKTIDEVVEIFNRVNSGGTKLSKGDLALARISADRPAARNELRSLLEKWNHVGYNFKIDWLLRAVTAVETRQARFSGLRDVDPDDFADAIVRTERSLDFLLNLISDRLGLDHDRVLGGRYALPAISPFVDDHGGSISDDALQRKILYWYVNSFMWGRYSSSTETKMQRDLEALDRAGVDGLIEELRLARTSLEVRPEDLDAWSTGARLYPVLYMMSRVGGARDLSTGLGLSAAMLGQDSSLHVHHVFPKKLLYEAGYKRPQVNALANLSFLTAKSNMSIGARNPSEYLAEVAQKHPGVLQSQWIPEDPTLWHIDRYLDFLAARRALMAKSINAFLSELLHGESAVELPQITPELTAHVPTYGEEENGEIRRIHDLVVKLGLASPDVEFEVVDPDSGELQAMADLAWPDGVQEGLTEPVAFLAEPDSEMEERLNELGYRYFTSVERLVWYLEELVGVDLDGDGELGEPEVTEPMDGSILDAWDPTSDDAIAAAFLGMLSPDAVRVLQFLAERSPEQFSGDQIARELGMPSGNLSVAGTLSSVGFACKKVGRAHPFVYTESDGSGGGWYHLTTTMAELLRRASFDSKSDQIDPGAQPSDEAAASHESLEREWNAVMGSIYKRAKTEAGYTATYFLEMLGNRGGLGTAQYLLHTDKPSDGFTHLWERSRLDLTVEAHVLEPRFEPLFTLEERTIARDRLESYGFSPR